MATSAIESVGSKIDAAPRKRGRFSLMLRAGAAALLLTTGAAAAASIGDTAPRQAAVGIDAPPAPKAHGSLLPTIKLDGEKAPSVRRVSDEVQVARLAFDAQQLFSYLNFLKTQQDVGSYLVAMANSEAAQLQADAARAQTNYVQQNPAVYSESNMGDFLNCVRNRESGGNYGVYNSGGSGAAGAYQFMPGTWNSIAESSGRGDLVGLDPAQALPEDQDSMAQALYAQQGAAPWGGGC